MKYEDRYYKKYAWQRCGQIMLMIFLDIKTTTLTDR